MQKKRMPKSNSERTTLNPLEQQTTYHIDGRSFVVQPVFKEANANSLGAILLRLMQADFENNK